MRHAFLLLCILALGACGSGEERLPDDPSDAPQQIEGEGIALGPKEMIDLQANGLTVPPQDGDEALEVPFGSNRAAAEATLASVLGDVLGRSENAECPAGPLETTEYKGLTLYFQGEDGFVGWFAMDPYLPPETRLTLLATDGIEMVEGSTLGEEFVISDLIGQSISGLFESDGDEARVASLWAGTTCNFR